MVATSRHGLAEGEVAPSKAQPEDLLSSATSEGSHKVQLLQSGRFHDQQNRTSCTLFFGLCICVLCTAMCQESG